MGWPLRLVPLDPRFPALDRRLPPLIPRLPTSNPFLALRDLFRTQLPW
jgi:hypothetical protein